MRLLLVFAGVLYMNLATYASLPIQTTFTESPTIKEKYLDIARKKRKTRKSKRSKKRRPSKRAERQLIKAVGGKANYNKWKKSHIKNMAVHIP